jgi:periplasmic protein TonB
MRRPAILLASFALLFAGLGHAQTVVDRPSGSIVTQPDWVRRPSDSEFKAVYPPVARAAKVEGRASIRCTIDNDGRLQNCSVTSETPAGHGFGEAALKLSHLMFMRGMTKDGSAVAGGRITIPISFRLPHD